MQPFRWFQIISGSRRDAVALVYARLLAVALSYSFAKIRSSPIIFKVDDTTLSKSMTIMAGGSQLQAHRAKAKRDMEMSRNNRSKSRTEIQQVHRNDSESDTSGSPINEFSNMSTYRVPTKSRGGKMEPLCAFSLFIFMCIYSYICVRVCVCACFY